MAGVRVESQRSLENTLLYTTSASSSSRQTSLSPGTTDHLRTLTSNLRSSAREVRGTAPTRSVFSSNLTPHTSSLLQGKGRSGAGTPGLLTQQKPLSTLGSRSSLASSSLTQQRSSLSTLRTTSTAASSSLLSSTTAARNLTKSGLLSSSLLTRSSVESKLTSASLLTSKKQTSPEVARKPTPPQLVSGTKTSLFFSTKASPQLRKSGSLLSSSTGKVSPSKLLLSSQLTRTSLSKSTLHSSSGGLLKKVQPTASKLSSSTSTSNEEKEKRVVVATAARPVTEETEGAPVYKFKSEEALAHQREKFLPPEIDANVQAPLAPVGEIVQLKTTVINAVATSLLCSPDFKSLSDPTRQNLTKLGEQLSNRDPEFILKVALYTRNDLNIRTTANFLLALASNLQTCRPYLRKYYCASIRLPSDWIEVAEVYQTFHDKSLNFGALPTALRKVMASKFVEFDVYQLGKYNKDKSKKKEKKVEKKKKDKGEEGGETKDDSVVPPQRSDTSTTVESELSVAVPSDTETEEEVERLSFTLKQLIRKIHISEPVEPVMCLLGKKYPEDPETFRRSRLPGTWEEERAGKRMKLATPETWETTVSLHGNKAGTWEQLIDHNKLPFMAMLRNLRNLIIANVSQSHHRWVLGKLNDERAVVNSRQFPFRFFSAYEVIAELEKIADGEIPPKYKPRKGKKAPKPPPKVDRELLKRYRSALDNALKIATSYNVKPISGSTLILCNVGSNMNRSCTSARGLGKPRTVQEVGILLGLMCKYSCEQCTMIVYGESNHAQVQLKEGTILHNMEHVQQVSVEQKLTESEGVIPSKILYNMLVSRSPVDNIVLLTDAMKLYDSQGREMMDFLQKYRHMVNPDLLFVSVDLSGRSSGISGTIHPEHKNDVYLAGYSDQILRFIAERGDSGQLTYVDNIDKAYNLKELPRSALLSQEAASSRTATTSLSAEKALLASTQRQKWRTVRVFISSTFRDMHGERDLLTRFVFPELRARAHSRQIQLYEIDLRWGVTEEDTRHHRALEICLNEISRCNYFLGLLGERYGWILNDEVIGKVSDFEWLKDDCVGHSITEVEMKHACLRDPDTANGKAFFYFRDPSVSLAIPEKHRTHFESESQEAREKIQRLKSEIRTSGLEVYDGYHSKWLGVLEDKPMVGGLEDFGQRVLHNIWNAIKRDFPDDETGLDPVAEATAAHNAFAENHAGSFVGRRSLLSKAEEMVEQEEGGVLVMEGKPGSGKSAFMAALAQQCSIRPSFEVLTHFLGAAPSSTNITSILTRLCHEMKRRFNLDRDVPEEYPELVNTWTDFLEDGRSAAGGSKLLLFIDGLDLLEEKHNARGMDWLPGRLPTGVVVVVSTVEKGEISTNLKKRNPPPTSLTVGRMNEWDKADMVREKLARHRKSLDESPFNNQMKLLLSKKDAANPLFLHLACEELRVFGIFEEVSSFLKSLPPTLPHLLQEVLGRIEGELGQDLVSVSLSLLCLVRNGLRECELSGLASLYFMSKTTQSEADASVPAMTLSRLLRCLQGFLQPTSEETSDLLSLAHKDIETAVKLRYMKGRGEKEREFHRLLATYFKTECDPTGEQTYAGSNIRAFNELPHHLMCSGQWKELEEIVCDVNFVVAKCQLGSAQNLLEDYTPSMEEVPAGKVREIATYVSQPRVEIFRSFVSRNLHVLTVAPALALQQAINESSSSLIATEAERVLLDNPQPLVRWLNRSPGENRCHLTIPSSSEVTCVAVSGDSKQFAAGFRNCSVRVFSTATGAEIQSFVGHAAEITSLCFVGSHALCSGSHDTNLSLWDLKGGFRIASLTSHSRSVRGCAADAAGKVLVSVSWDTNIRVWDGRTGKQTCFLNQKGGRNCPLNCVSFHPSSNQLIAVGSWDTTVKIWDVFSRKRVKVLKGHQTSVQACAYAPSGRHIVSAALDGEVKVWSTKSGSAVGSIAGHFDPVNAISYTPNGQYLLTASSDQLVKVWSGSLGQRVANVGKSEYGYAHCVVHSRQNQTVLVGYHDGHVRKFNTQTEVEEFAVRLHDKAVVAVGAQGRFSMSASADGTIKIWEGPSSLPRHLLLEGHKAGITCAAWTKYGLASAAEDFSLFFWPHELTHYTRMWNQNKSSTKLSVYPLISLKGHTSTISALSFSGDGLKMASASRDQTVIMWDLITMKEARTMHDCHKDWITAISFPDAGSDTLITGSNDFNLKLWNVSTGEERITFRGHTSAINSVSFSHGYVVSAAFDGSVKVWTRKGVEITTLHCHQQRVNACVLDVPHTTDNSSWADIVEQEEEAKDQKSKLEDVLVVTASDDGTVGVWKPFVPNEVTALVGHSDRVLAVSSTFNNEIISSSRDKTIRIWSPKLPEKMGGVSVTSSTHAHVGEVTSVTASMPYIATGGRDGQVLIWTTTRIDENNKRCLNLKKLYCIKSSDAAVTSLACIGANNRVVKLAVGRDDGSIGKYEFSDTTFPVETGVMGPATLMGAHPVSDLAVAHGGKCLVAGSWSKVVSAVRTEGGTVAGKMEEHSGWVMGVTVVEEGGEYFSLSIGLNRLLCKWPLGQSRRKTPSSSAVRYGIPSEGKNDAWLLCICPVNSTHVAIGDSGGRVWFWNQVTRKVDFSKKIHRCAINGVAAVGVTLATGSADGSIKIWRVSSGRTKDIVQVGHFHARSSVTSLKAYAMGRKGEGQPIILTAGDQLGNVMLLEYSATD